MLHSEIIRLKELLGNLEGTIFFYDIPEKLADE